MPFYCGKLWELKELEGDAILALHGLAQGKLCLVMLFFHCKYVGASINVISQFDIEHRTCKVALYCNITTHYHKWWFTS